MVAIVSHIFTVAAASSDPPRYTVHVVLFAAVRLVRRCAAKRDPMTPLSFDISERYELGEHAWSWRLKEQEIRFRGAGRYSQLVSQRIPASESQVDSIIHAFDLLQVWQWRSDYDPQDVDVAVCDGSSWTFNVAFNGKTHRAAGFNAYPSFADPAETSLSRDRFDLHVAAIYSTFNIDYYIERSRP